MHLFVSIAETDQPTREAVEKEVELGDDVTLDCAPRQQTQTRFQWRKDGVTLRNNRKYLVEGSLLTIRRSIHSDEGLYECFDENFIGFARTSVRLFVNGMLVVFHACNHS